VVAFCFFAGEDELVEVRVVAVEGGEDEVVQVFEGGIAGDVEDAVQFVGRHSVVFDERYFEAVDVDGHGVLRLGAVSLDADFSPAWRRLEIEADALCVGKAQFVCADKVAVDAGFRLAAG
jgi:hypothetical protein